MGKKIIAIDFDGTCVTHEYPEIGKDIGAVPVLKKLVATDWKIILWTMRAGDTLNEAIQWFGKHNIPLWGANSNPEQHTWSRSPKAYAQIYIDDAALGCPLMSPEVGARPFVDWARIEELLTAKGAI